MTVHSAPLPATPTWTRPVSPTEAGPRRGCVPAPGLEADTRVIDALDGAGLPLDPTTRGRMERGLGADFSRVRVHTGGSAAHTARSLDALACTVGNDILFAPGRYAPHTAAGTRLLAHELGHVLQQRAGRPMVLRQPAGAPVAPPQATGQGDYVEAVIAHLRAAAGYYSTVFPVPVSRPGQEPLGGVRVRVDRLGTQLAGWLRSRDTAANLIDTALGGDKNLTDQLRVAYREAVRTLIAAAAREGRRANQDAPTGPSPRELYQRHLSVIHEWAWPEATPDPGANRLLDAIPEAERAQIRVDLRNWTLTTAVLDGYFHPRALLPSLPADTTVVVGPGLGDRLRRGLTGVAVMLITTASPAMQVNTSVTMVLDLGRYGGDNAGYRFTYLQRAGTPRREVLVERLGSVGLDQRPPARQTVPQDVFARHGFVRGGGWTDGQFAAVQTAVSQIPESMLSAVRGITFVRTAGAHPTDPRAGAAYDMETHTITVYDRAFADASLSVQRFHGPGERQSSELDRLIAHEIGHALDYVSLRPLRTSYVAGIAEQGRFHPQPIRGSSRVTLPPREIAGWRALQARIERRGRALQAARSESGDRFAPGASGGLDRTDQLPAGEVSAFRAAAALDGPTRITTYSEEAWREYFAEAFSLYVSEPDTLSRLRPHVYDYFAAKYPDPARPPRTPAAGSAANPGRP